MNFQIERVSSASTPSQQRNPSTYHRIVIKAGSTLLTKGESGLDADMMATIADQICRLHRNRVEVILVTSGAVAAGRHILGTSQQRKDLPFRQVLAAVGQSHLMQAYEQLFNQRNLIIAQALLSRRDFIDRLGYLNIRNTLLGLLENHALPIVNENDVVAVDELTGDTFGDNDTLSAMVANLVDADLLIILGEIEGLYTSDPNIDPNAKFVPSVEHFSKEIEMMGGPSWESTGRGGMATKLDAARLASASGIETVIANGRKPDILMRLVKGDKIGTRFTASGTKLESRKRWMLSGLSTKCHILIDEGAVEAVTIENKSLLPAGVIEVLGSFHRGDIVSIVNPIKTQIACGIANYSSNELLQIKGLHSDRIQHILGHQYGNDVVHRSNMVVL